MKFEKPKFSTVAICIGIFFIFLLISFPFQNLKGWVFNEIYRRTGIIIVADDLYLSLFGWPGLGMKNVDVTLPVGNSELDITAKKMIFRVGLGSLFPPSPSVSLKLLGLREGGNLYVSATTGSEVTSIGVQADKVTLDQFDIPGVSDKARGILNADFDVDWNSADPSKSTGHMKLSVDKLITPMFNDPWITIPTLKIGKLDGVLQIQNGTITTKKFQIGTTESDLSATLNVTLQLQKALPDSRLKLILNLNLAKDHQNETGLTIASYLTGYKKSPGSYAYVFDDTLRTFDASTGHFLFPSSRSGL